jgi:hypothetical protein
MVVTSNSGPATSEMKGLVRGFEVSVVVLVLLVPFIKLLSNCAVADGRHRVTQRRKKRTVRSRVSRCILRLQVPV